MQLTARQRQYIKKKAHPHEPDPSELAGELNIVPFLDIVVNLIMFMLATSVVAIQLTQIETTLPTSSGGRSGGAKEAQLNLSVTVTENGIIVASAGGKMGPGCTPAATGLTVARERGEYKWPDLVACIRKIKTTYEAAQDEEQVIVGADPTVAYQHLITAMDSVRGTTESPLFPKVLLSAGVR